MATKSLKEIKVVIIECGEPIYFLFNDTADDPQATYALASFNRGEYIHGIKSDNNNEVYIPFHAIDNILIRKSDTTVADRPDPYYCEDSDGCVVAFSGTVTTTQSGQYARSEPFNFVDYSQESIKVTLNGQEYNLQKVDGAPVYNSASDGISVSGSGGETEWTASVLMTPTAGTYEMKIEIC